MDRITSMRTLAILATAGLSILAVIGDYFLKRASADGTPFRTTAFLVGFVIYASTAFGSVFVFRHLKLATSGGVYAVCLVLALTVMGLVGFRETLRATEVVGIAMAICSLVLLTRFA
jgi:drug/metabolite transporter (DMT)-like permease